MHVLLAVVQLVVNLVVLLEQKLAKIVVNMHVQLNVKKVANREVADLVVLQV